MPVKFLLSYTLEAFYPLRPYKDCSLEQLLRVLATSDKGIQKKINYFFCLSFQEILDNTFHAEELARISLTQSMKLGFNGKLNFTLNSEL